MTLSLRTWKLFTVNPNKQVHDLGNGATSKIFLESKGQMFSLNRCWWRGWGQRVVLLTYRPSLKVQTVQEIPSPSRFSLGSPHLGSAFEPPSILQVRGELTPLSSGLWVYFETLGVFFSLITLVVFPDSWWVFQSAGNYLHFVILSIQNWLYLARREYSVDVFVK